MPPGDWRNHLEHQRVEVLEADPLNLMTVPWIDGLTEIVERWLSAT
jgi:hypothetical protein